MKPVSLALAALPALALAFSAVADDAAVTVVASDPGAVAVVRANPSNLGVVAPGTAAGPDERVVVAPPRTATVVYVYPTTPQSFIPVAMLPSFLVQPGAPLPEISNYVVQSVPIPMLAGQPAIAAAADLDCADLGGPVYVGAVDAYHLDRNGNGIGCEPADR